MKNKIRRTILEMTLFGVVVSLSGGALARLNTYTPTTVTAGGHTTLAMVQVPVPVEPAMEGHAVSYTVVCVMKKGVLSCQP